MSYERINVETEAQNFINRGWKPAAGIAFQVNLFSEDNALGCLIGSMAYPKAEPETRSLGTSDCMKLLGSLNEKGDYTDEDLYHYHMGLARGWDARVNNIGGVHYFDDPQRWHEAEQFGYLDGLAVASKVFHKLECIENQRMRREHLNSLTEVGG